MKIRITLASAITVDGVKVNQLMMREPLWGDQLAVNEVSQDAAEREVAMFSRLLGIAAEPLHPVSDRDLARLQLAYKRLSSEDDQVAEAAIADEVAEDGSTRLRVTLTGPVQINGVPEASLVMREPQIGDQLDLAKLNATGAEYERQLLSRLVDASPDDLKNLPLRDLARLQKGYLRQVADDAKEADFLVVVDA